MRLQVGSLLGVLGLAAKAEVCIQNLIVWPSASRKVLGILLINIGEKALYVYKNIKKCAPLLMKKNISLEKIESSVFLFVCLIFIYPYHG